MQEMNWYWCELCDHQAVGCDKCEFGSCSGCGCDECWEMFETANKMIHEGKAPPKESIPFVPNEIDKLLGKSNESDQR